MKKKWIINILALLGVIVLIALDQWTKWLAMLHLNPANGGYDRIWWDGVFRLHYLENHGAAFGMLQGKSVFFVLITVVICILLCWIFQKIPAEKHFLPLHIISVCVMAGAIGNFIDRIRFRYVVDFFYFELINFPIFNVADIYVTCSVFLFILLFLFYYKEEDLNRILPSKKKIK